MAQHDPTHVPSTFMVKVVRTTIAPLGLALWIVTSGMACTSQDNDGALKLVLASALPTAIESLNLEVETLTSDQLQIQLGGTLGDSLLATIDSYPLLGARAWAPSVNILLFPMASSAHVAFEIELATRLVATARGADHEIEVVRDPDSPSNALVWIQFDSASASSGVGATVAYDSFRYVLAAPTRELISDALNVLDHIWTVHEWNH